MVNIKSWMPGLALVLLAAGCDGGPATPSGGLNESLVLSLKQTVRVPDARLSLTFDAVAGDSRCPGDALCITGGDAVVQITVAPFVGQPVRHELHTGNPTTVRQGDFLIDLEELAPYPFSSRPFDPATYQATLRVAQVR